MTVARAMSVVLAGVRGYPVQVETGISAGLPAFVLAGLPDSALREARDRVRAAVINSGEPWPQTKVTAALCPASLPKASPGLDLAIAVAVLGAAGRVRQAALDGVMFLSGLGLDGQLRPVPGTLPAVLAAARTGLRTAVVAPGNAAEAGLVPGIRVVPAVCLRDLVAWLRGGDLPPLPDKPHDQERAGPHSPRDLAQVPGQAAARRAAQVCAAGGHNLSLLGPPGAGGAMLAERIPTILPDLDPAAALEVTAIRSAAGLLPPGGDLVRRPPFSAPHHTVSRAAVTGGGSSVIGPGAVSLAHHGILFLDQAPEFGRDVLDALRQPLETGQVIITRSGTRAAFPARFCLVLASSPCACTAAGAGSCQCSPAQRRRYQARLSGPLLDRADVKTELSPLTRADLQRDCGGESSRTVAGRVAAARDRAARRYAGTPWRLNADVPGAELRRSYPVRPGALTRLDQATEAGCLSARTAGKVLRVSWTLADLAGNDRPGADEVHTALLLRLGVTP